MEKLPYALGLVYAAMGLIFFCLMGADKRFARRGARRVPERRLFFFALFGGGLGGLLGMYTFRHKTRHWYFVVGFWGLTVLQLAALGYLAWRYIPF